MIHIILHTPLYVWPLLVYLIWGGLKSRTTYVVSWKHLVTMPALLFLWSIYAVITRHGTSSLYLWAISLSIGIWLGSLTTRRIQLQFDKQKHLIEVGGSWIPLMLSLSIFSLRYFLGASYGLHPDLSRAPYLLAVENVATLVSGMFIGRLLGYWQRCKSSAHIDLISSK